MVTLGAGLRGDRKVWRQPLTRARQPPQVTWASLCPVLTRKTLNPARGPKGPALAAAHSGNTSDHHCHVDRCCNPTTSPSKFPVSSPLGMAYFTLRPTAPPAHLNLATGVSIGANRTQRHGGPSSSHLANHQTPRHALRVVPPVTLATVYLLCWLWVSYHLALSRPAALRSCPFSLTAPRVDISHQETHSAAHGCQAPGLTPHPL